MTECRVISTVIPDVPQATLGCVVYDGMIDYKRDVPDDEIQALADLPTTKHLAKLVPTMGIDEVGHVRMKPILEPVLDVEGEQVEGPEGPLFYVVGQEPDLDENGDEVIEGIGEPIKLSNDTIVTTDKTIVTRHEWPPYSNAGTLPEVAEAPEVIRR
jgi:hypothetical protein